MHSIKVLFLGKRLKDIYPHATWFQVLKFRIRKFFRKLSIITATLLALYTALYIGKTFYPNTTYAIQEVEVPVTADSPVLDRIAHCESPTGQFDRNGQVVINATEDIGAYQINVPTWGRKAKELHLNLAVEADNKAMAEWIYANKGTGAWSSSSHCWNK